MENKDSEQKPRPSWQVSSYPELRIFLVSDSAFLGLQLARKLLSKGAIVYYLCHNQEHRRAAKSLKVFPHLILLKDKAPQDFDYAFHLATLSLSQQKFSPLKTLQLCLSHDAKFLFASCDPETYPKSLFMPFTRLKKVDWRLVYFAFVYGSVQETDSAIALIFSQLKQARLIFPAEPQATLYPLYFEDLIEGLLRAMFSRDSAEKTYFLAGLEKINLLDLVLRVKRSSRQELKIITPLAKERPVIPSVDSTLFEKIRKSWWRLLFKPQVNVDEGIKRMWSDLNRSPKSKNWSLGLSWPSLRWPRFKLPEFNLAAVFGSKASYRPRLRLKFKLSLRPLFFLFLMVLLAFLVSLSPLLYFTGSSFLGLRHFQKLKQAVDEANFAAVSQEALLAQKHFLRARQTLWQFTPLFNFFLNQRTQTLENLVGLALDLAKTLTESEKTFKSAKSLSEIVMRNKIGDPKAEVSNLQVDLAQIESKLAFAQIQLSSLKGEKLPFDGSFRPQLQKLTETVPELRQKLLFAKKILSLCPELLAFDAKKSYLVLFQNNSELRPTGGFIGSYGILTFEKGRLLDFRVEDVYAADGQLKGHVEPPQPIKKYLDKGNWYLRDANWSPDFPTTAVQTSWFLEKETGQRVDGVIGVNLNMVKSLLQAFGPVELPEYNEKITASNLFERAEYHAEINFFPGSQQKKSFLAALTAFLFEKAKLADPQASLTLFGALEENLQAKDIMFTFDDRILQQRLQFLGWTGEIKTISFGRESQFKGPGIIDYLMLVDANVGVNKANYFIEREVAYEATILKEGQVAVQTEVTYRNRSPSQAWPGGTYKNYLRLYLPDDVREILVEQKGEKDKEFKILKQEKIDQDKEFDKTVFGFLMEVPPQEEKKLRIHFQRGIRMPFKANPVDYVLYCQKQSGTKSDQLTAKLNYPAFLKPVKVMPAGTWTVQKLSFETEWTQDRLFAVEFSQ